MMNFFKDCLISPFYSEINEFSEKDYSRLQKAKTSKEYYAIFYTIREERRLLYIQYAKDIMLFVNQN